MPRYVDDDYEQALLTKYLRKHEKPQHLSGERLNINAAPLLAELVTRYGFEDIRDAVIHALCEYLRVPLSDYPLMRHGSSTRINLGTSLGRAQVRLPTVLCERVKEHTKHMHVDSSYVYIMALKDLHNKVSSVETDEVPY